MDDQSENVQKIDSELKKWARLGTRHKQYLETLFASTRPSHVVEDLHHSHERVVESFRILLRIAGYPQEIIDDADKFATGVWAVCPPVEWDRL